MLEQGEFEKIPADLKWRSWLLLGGLVIASSIWMPWRFTTGLLLGGILANINFHFLHKALIKFLVVHKTSKGLVFESMVRLFVLGVILAVLLKYQWVDVFGLLLGLSVVVINLFMIALMEIKSLVLNRR